MKGIGIESIRKIISDLPRRNANWDFNPSLVTFTPGMAKRATSVFAAAPIIQGKRDTTGTPDELSFLTGNLIAGSEFYTNCDFNQGSICFRITPEWNGNDGLNHVLLSFNWSSFIIRKTAGNALGIYTTAGNLVAVSIAGWVAGTTYNVCIRWDTKNTIDGTNYGCISINDVHVFSGTIPNINAPNASGYIGVDTGGDYPANAIIEGFTIYRRVLYDGTYGTDVGNGDEVALIAAGVDPCTITGSWDVVFCLPTNATTGALVTGTGEAWSHPHSSNLLTPINGFMADTAWNNWTAVGAPSGSAVLATAEKIFAWGYKFTATGAGDGYKKTLAVTAGNVYGIRVIAHSDGTGQPRVIVYDETGSAVVLTITGTITSTRTTPNVLIGSFTVPVGCTSISVRLLNVVATNIVYFHQCELLLSATAFTIGKFYGGKGTGALSNAALQAGLGSPAGFAVARVTGVSPTFPFTYIIALDDVSLTVTPASAANSVESGGIRVDGWDFAPQPIPAGRLFANVGWTRIRYLPRHNGADALKFGSATPYIADWYGDINNYFYIYWSAANTMTLAFKSAGGALQTGNWATAGAILAGGNYLLEIKYDAGNMYLYVDNVLRITVTSPIAFTTIPVFCYPATANTVVAGQHDDAVLLNP